MIEPWYSSFGGRDFYVECCAMPLVPPTNFIYLSWGERLRDDMTGYTSWAGQTHEITDASMARVVQLLYKKVLPSYFQRLERMEGFLALIEKRPNPDHHTYFERACCLVKLRRLDEASGHLTEALRRYMQDGRSWCFPKAAQCEEMLKAIRNGLSLQLYDRWKQETIRDLKLEKIVPNYHEPREPLE